MISKITSVLSFPLQISVIYPWWETPHTQNGQYTEEKRNILPTTGIWHTVFIFSPCMHSHFRRVWLFMTPWTVASQVPLSMGFSRQKYWSWLPCPPPMIFSMQGWNPRLRHLLNWQAGSLPLGLPGMWDLVPWSGMEPGPPELGVWSPSH